MCAPAAWTSSASTGSAALYAPVLAGQQLPVNLTRFLFLDPGAGDFYVDWDKTANDAVAILRGQAGRNPYDRWLSDLIGELSTRSQDLRARWAAHNVRLHRTGPKQLHHPVVGDLESTYEALELPADPGLTMITYTAEPGSASQEALDFLASWAATLDQPDSQQRPGHPTKPDPGAASRISINRSEMELQPKQPSVKGPAERFTGDVWYDVIASGEAPSRIRVNVVRFTPGARNAWHAHALGQTLHVTEGVGLIQSRGGQVIQIRPGDTIYTPPGEWHWHGAAPDHFMSHLAIWEAPDSGPESKWGDLVTDEEYQNPPAAGSR